jgi:endonuclease/exonuclease/phosphatase (EEP) superfamily protein YafD
MASAHIVAGPAAGPAPRARRRPGGRWLTANLLFGAADPVALVDLVRTHRVDVLTLQEFTPEAEVSPDRAGLAGLLPHRQVNPEPGTTGSALYSRFSLSDGGVRRNGGGFTQAYATVWPDGGPPVLVESAHPLAPSAQHPLPDWRADLAAQPPATPDGPLRILAGDFNATLDHAPLRDLLDTGYVDAADAVGAGLVGTWGPYDGDPIPPVTIDHVLVDRRIAVTRVAVRSLPGSDHRPVLAELVLPRTGPRPAP